MGTLKVWPHLTIIAIVIAMVTGIGVGWWVRHRQNVNDQSVLTAARIQRVDGDVALNNNAASNTDNNEWIPATANQPFAAGDRIYTRENSHASIAFNGRNFARLYPNTSLDVLTLTDRQTQVALRDGSAVFDVGYLNPNQLFEVATPYGAVDFDQPGLYNVGIDNGNVLVSVLTGLAQVVGLGGSGRINKGETLRLVGQTAADVVLSRINNRDAGYLINDYYSYQYPHYYDGRYSDYNAYLNDPYYFDPYRRNVSYQYASWYLPGLNDLDYYGDWQNMNGYGYCWHPRVDSGWSPYEQGYWMTDYPYGPTWVSSEPWGYAPYHYGRWANLNSQWYWIPDTSSYPSYSPALVAFLPVGQDEIGWVPLGPGDAYAPRYYTSSWQPQYLTSYDNRSRFVNLDVPNAVTVVPIDDFTRLDNFRRERHADRHSLQNVQAVLDPLTLTPLRNAVVHSAWGRGKIDLPPGIAKKLHDTSVVTSADPITPSFRRDLARNMRVERVADRVKTQQFKVRDERRAEQTAPDTSRNLRVDNVRGIDQLRNRQVKDRQIDRAMQQAQAERAAQAAGQGAQGLRVGRPVHQQRVQREMSRPQPPRAMERPGRINERKPVERAPRPVYQPPVMQQQPRALERGRPARVERPQMRVERPQMRAERPAAAAPVQAPRQERPQAQPGGGNKGGPPAGNPHGQGGGGDRQKGGPPAGNPHGGGKGKKP